MTKKDKILYTTLKLTVSQGIQETSMSQISTVSGIAVGTIYHHFKSKNEIINQIYLELKRDFGKVLLAKTKHLTDYKLQFSQIWRNLFEYYNQNELKFKFSQYIGHLPIIEEKTREEGLTYYAPIIDFFEKGIETKIFKPVNINLLTETIHGNVVSLAQLSHQKSIEVTEIILNQAINMSWDSIYNQ